MSKITKEEAHEAREILFKFATSNEKYNLLEGRKLNKVLGNFIDGNAYFPQLSEDVEEDLKYVGENYQLNIRTAPMGLLKCSIEYDNIKQHILALESKLQQISDVVEEFGNKYPNFKWGDNFQSKIKSILEGDTNGTK